MTSTPRVQRHRHRRANGITVVPIEVTARMISRLVADGYLSDGASRDVISVALSKMLGGFDSLPSMGCLGRSLGRSFSSPRGQQRRRDKMVRPRAPCRASPSQPVRRPRWLKTSLLPCQPLSSRF